LMAFTSAHVSPALLTTDFVGCMAHSSAAPVSVLELVAARTANVILFCFTV
jgi:hypothetical protein